MTETQFSEKQILAGLFECWIDAMGTDRPFDAETRVDLHMKANDEWEDSDLADLFFRFEKHFGFESTLDEWTEELGIANVPSLDIWENEIAPKFTFGALARFIQKRAVNTVSFKPVMVINKECRPAGVFYGIRQISNQLVSAKCPVTPSTKIIDAFRGNTLEDFWYQLRWMTESVIPELPASWRNMCIRGIAEYYFYLGCVCYFIAGGISVYTSNIIYGIVTTALILCGQYLIHIYNLKRKYKINPLPPELDTFRDLAMLIANSDCDAVRKCEAMEH